MRYGNMKVYKIDGVDFKMTPKNTFNLAHEGKDVTYVDYFKEKYGYVIKNDKQPLVRVICKAPKFSTLKDPKDQTIYLVPEMLTLTGLSDAQKSDFRIMKSLDPFTKMTPQRRMQDSSKIIDRLRNQE
jgi:aubergine-like protein